MNEEKTKNIKPENQINLSKRSFFREKNLELP